jgi:hypothetical protein
LPANFTVFATQPSMASVIRFHQSLRCSRPRTQSNTKGLIRCPKRKRIGSC